MLVSCTDEQIEVFTFFLSQISFVNDLLILNVLVKLLIGLLYTIFSFLDSPIMAIDWLASYFINYVHMAGYSYHSVNSNSHTVNIDIAFLWELSKFDHLQNPNLLTDYDKTLQN